MKIYMIEILSNDSDKYEALSYSHYTVYGHRIYAVTDKKEYCKKFMEERDNKLFKVLKFEISDDHDFEWFINSESITGLELDYHEYNTVFDDNGYLKQGIAKVLSTEDEYDYLTYSADDIILNTMSDTISGIVESVKALSNLDVDGYSLCDSILYLFNEDVRSALEDLDICQNITITESIIDSEGWWEYNIDQLYIYCKVFKNTYRNGIIL